MRLKMIGLAGVSLLLLAGCGRNPPLAQADNGACVQKPVCAAPAQSPPVATTPPSRYDAPRPRRAVRYGARRWRSGGGDRYEAEARDYGQVYSTGDTRYAGVRVQVQSSDSYASSSQSDTTYSSYGGAAVYVSGGQGVAGGCPGPCGTGRPRAAGRDRDGYLTWPSK